MGDIINGFKSAFVARSNKPEEPPQPNADLTRLASPSSEPTPTGYNWHFLNSGSLDPHDTYDDIFPYTNAIAQRFSTVVPYAVDSNGDRISPPPQAIAALYAPNNTYSCLEFLKFIATNMLTQTHLDILIWTRNGRQVVPGGNVRPDNIAGYTFLPLNSRRYNSTRSDYYHEVNMTINGLEQQKQFTRDETISLSYSQHPEDPTRGISPAMTIQQWATLNDCLADFEQGFFDNGAVPAGMLGIVADSPEDFQRSKNKMEDTFRGAGNNNGVVYNYIPVDPMSRKPEDHGKLVWVPFQQANNSLDLGTLDGMVTNRLGSAMGVPDIVRGIDDSQTYNNAQMAERSFIENTLKPLLMTVWDKWQFELDRITGGLGYAINFELDLPAQTDVEHVQAETQSTQVATLIALVNSGATVQSAVRALGLPDEYGDLELKPVTEMALPTEDDTPSQDQGPTIQPDMTISEKGAGLEQDQPNVDRFRLSLLGSARSDYDKVLKLSREMMEAIIEVARTSKNSREDRLGAIAVEWVDGTYAAYEDRILAYAKRTGVTLKEAVKELAKTDPDIHAIVVNYTDAQLTAIFDWGNLPDPYSDAYKDRLKHVARDTVHNGYSSVIDILQQAEDDGWTREQTEEALRDYVDGNRAQLLARNELVNAERLGALFSAKAMADDLGIVIEKVWTTTSERPCPFCSHMDGTSKPLDETFMDLGDSLKIGDKTYVNDFASKMTCDGHPNCKCVLTYQVKGAKEDENGD